MNFDDLIAIDIHTHAEEPCCTHRDDGYNEFQAGMAKYFRNPAGAEGMLPTVPQTAEYFRARKIGADSARNSTTSCALPTRRRKIQQSISINSTHRVSIS